jgi:hypothetical protein
MRRFFAANEWPLRRVSHWRRFSHVGARQIHFASRYTIRAPRKSLQDAGDTPTVSVSPSAVAAVVGALLKHHNVDAARSITQELENTQKYTMSSGSEFYTATAAVEAASGAAGSTRTTNKVFRQVLQSHLSLTDDLIRQVISVDLNNNQIEAAMGKLDTVLNVLATSQQAGTVRTCYI